MIVIVDYGMGNIGSILNMLRRIGAPAKASGDPVEIRSADRLILPGVGAFASGMEALARLGLDDVLHLKVIDQRTPMLGLCLGMQLFAKGSEEGGGVGLGWLDADVVRFKNSPGGSTLKIPHMGWNTLTPRRAHPVLPVSVAESRYYFVHSYHLVCHDEADVVATTSYGGVFPSVVARNSVWGVQFHPEKSHRFGMELLRAFAEAAEV